MCDFFVLPVIHAEGRRELLSAAVQLNWLGASRLVVVVRNKGKCSCGSVLNRGRVKCSVES